MGNGGGESGLPLENKVANQAGALGGGGGSRGEGPCLEDWRSGTIPVPAGD